MRLLMVTDNSGDQHIVEQILNSEELDCDSVWVPHSPRALEQLQVANFDLLYISFSDSRQFDTLAQITEQKIGIPIVAVTELGNEALLKEVLELGVDEYLVKDSENRYLTLLPTIIRRIRRRWQDQQLYRQSTVELYDSEGKYRVPVDAISDAIHVVDADLRLRLINKAFVAWCAELGVETNIIGKKVFEAFPFLTSKVYNEYRWVFESGRTLVTTEVHTVGRVEVHTETRKLPVFEGQQVCGVVTIVRNISKEIEAQGSLTANEEMAGQQAQKISRIGNWETDLISGKTVWSDELQRMLGVNPADFDHDVGRIIKKLVHPDDLDLVINVPLQATGEAIRQNPDIENAVIELPTIEYRIILPDGMEKVVLADGNLVFRAGYPVTMIGTIQDITQRKHVEIEIRRQTAQLEALRQLGLELAARLDLDTLLHSIVSQAIKLVGGTSGALYLYLADQNVLQLTTSIGLDTAPAGIKLNKGEGLAGKVWETGRPLIVDNYQQWPGRAEIYADYDWTAVIGVPICLGSGTAAEIFLGVLDVWGKSPQLFLPADVDLLSMFATQAAIAVQNAKLYAETRRRTREQEIVSRIARALNTLDVKDAYPVLLEGLQSLTACDRVSLALLDKSLDRPENFILTSPVEFFEQKTFTSFSGTIAAESLLAGRPYISRNLVDETNYPGERVLFEAGLQSRVSLPLMAGGDVIGSLNLASRQPEHFHQNQLPVLQQIADAVAAAIKNTQLYKIEQRKREEADTLREAALALTTALHLDDVIERILAQLQQVVPYDTCSVQLYREGRGQGRLEIVGGRGFPNMSEILGLTFLVGADNPNTRVVQTYAPVIVDDAPEVYGDFLSGPHAEATIRSWLGVPMLLGNRLVGIFTLDKEEPKFYTREHAQLAEVFAVQAAVAIENARLYGEAQQQTEMMAVLLNEVNHRVKNNLTGIIGLLYLARSRGKVKDHASYQTTMDELIGRVRGLAAAHTMLSESEWTPLQLTDLAHEIIHGALRALPYDKQVSVNIVASTVRVTSDQAHNLALVINELATNTVKYALTNRNSAEIMFKAELCNRMVCCEYRDDGPGYPAEVLRLEQHSVGFELIKNIVQSNLRGEFSLENQAGAVTIVQFKAEV